MRFDGKTNKRKWKTLNVTKMSVVARPAQAPALMATIKAAAENPANPGTHISHKEGTSMDPKLIAQAIEAAMKAAPTGTTPEDIATAVAKALGEQDKDGKKKDDKDTPFDAMKAFGALEQDERLFVASLKAEDVEGYLKMDETARKALRTSIEQEIEAKKTADAEIKLADGTTIFKSKNPVAFSIAKSFQEKLNATEEKAAKAESELELQKLAKTAEDQYGQLPGDPEMKARLLKQREGMDEDTQKVFDEILTAAQNLASGSKLYKESGYTRMPGGAGGEESGLMQAIKAEKEAAK